MDKVAILSLANDLKRITQSIQRGANNNAQRFNQEAQKWLIQAQKSKGGSIHKLLTKIAKTLEEENNLIKAEECLMYSVLLQNRATFHK